MPVSVIGYAIAAIGYLLLSSLPLISRQGVPGRLVAFASVVTSIWALLAIKAAYDGGLWVVASGLADALRHAGWFAFVLAVIYRRNSQAAESRSLVILAALSAALPVLVALGWALIFLPDSLATLDLNKIWLGHLLMSIVGLVLLENFIRETPREATYGAKFVVIGLGGVFLYDVILYADALLFRTVNEDLVAARGIVNATILPLVGAALARNPEWEARIHVSRGVAFHSATLIAIGAFLLIMAAAGYYVRLAGGDWGAVLQVAVVFSAFLLAAIAVASGRFRAAVKLFLNRNFYSYRYDYRREWMRFLDALSDDRAGRLEDRVVHAVADVFDVPDALLWLREQAGFKPASAWNVRPPSGIETEDSPLVAALTEQVFCGPEAFGGSNLKVRDRPEWLLQFPRAWLITPLMHGEHLLGFLVLGQPRAARNFTLEDRDLLNVLSRHAASFLAEARALRELERTRRFEEFNRRSAFVLHGIKSVSTQLSFLVTNAERHMADPEFQEDLLLTLRDAVSKTDSLLRKLRADDATERETVPTRLGSLVEGVVRGFKRPPEVLEFESRVHEDATVDAPPDSLAAAIRNLVQNGLDAAGPKGHVQVVVERRVDEAVVAITDDGPGMNRDFMEHELFQPFRSTKESGFGIGVYECKQVVEHAGGRVEVESECGRGTTMRIILPWGDLRPNERSVVK